MVSVLNWILQAAFFIQALVIKSKQFIIYKMFALF